MTTAEKSWTTSRCGTDAGYVRHRRMSMAPCDACRAAHAAAERTRPYRLAKVSAS